MDGKDDGYLNYRVRWNKTKEKIRLTNRRLLCSIDLYSNSYQYFNCVSFPNNWCFLFNNFVFSVQNYPILQRKYVKGMISLTF